MAAPGSPGGPLSSLSSSPATDLSGTHGGPGKQRGAFGKHQGGGGGARQVGGGSAPVSSKEQDARAMELIDDLMKRGWTEEAASIMAGQAMNESSFDTRDKAGGDQGTAFGLMQWRGSRHTNMQRFAAQHPELKGIELSASFIDSEHHHGYGGTVHSKAYGTGSHDLSHATLDEAAIAGHYYEGYGDYPSTGRRVASSKKYYHMHHDKAAPNTTTTTKQKVSVRSTPGSNIFAQAFANTYGRA
jgi:Phage tail lysozyme